MSFHSALQKLFTILLVFTLTLDALAQTPWDDWNRVRSLALGSEIFVKTDSGRKYKGALSCATADELVLYAYQHGVFRRDRYRVVLPRKDVVEVRMLAREYSALVGAGIGAGAGVAVGAGLDTATARNHEMRGTVAVTFALLGSLLGMAIGRITAFMKGERIYVAPFVQSSPSADLNGQIHLEAR